MDINFFNQGAEARLGKTILPKAYRSIAGMGRAPFHGDVHRWQEKPLHHFSFWGCTTLSRPHPTLTG